MAIIVVPAGRCFRRDAAQNWVDPQPDKGTIELALEDGIVQFVWRHKDTGRADETLLIFQGEATFEKVTQDPTGRTHILRFNSSDQKYFFWFQRSSVERDLRAMVDINALLQDPGYVPGSAPLPASAPAAAASGIPATPAPASSSTSAPGAPSRLGAVDNRDPYDRSQWPPTPSAPRPTQESSGPVSARETVVTEGTSLLLADEMETEHQGRTQEAQQTQQHDMARMLVQWAQAGGLAGIQNDGPRLTDVLSPANVTILLSVHPNLVTRLLPHLPPSLNLGPNPPAHLVASVLTTPQFTDAIASLDSAFRHGGLPGSMMRELGLPEGAGTSVRAFLDALVAISPSASGAPATDDADTAMDQD